MIRILRLFRNPFAQMSPQPLHSVDLLRPLVQLIYDACQQTTLRCQHPVGHGVVCLMIHAVKNMLLRRDKKWVGIYENGNYGRR